MRLNENENDGDVSFFHQQLSLYHKAYFILMSLVVVGETYHSLLRHRTRAVYSGDTSRC